jgi:hypothetical protein
VTLSEHSIAVIKKYGKSAGRTQVAQRDTPLSVAVEYLLSTARSTDKTSKNAKNINSKSCDNFLIIIFLIIFV